MIESTRRKHERKRVALDVQLVRLNNAVAGRTRDISLGGAFIETDQPFSVGEECVVEIRVPASALVVRIAATVRWTTDDGMGVQWAALRAQHSWAINQIMSP